MARYDGKLEAAGEAVPDAAELLAALRGRAARPADRSDAIACYLSASDGWRDASRVLGGAFAPAGEPEPKSGGDAGAGLSGDKDA